MRSAPGRHRHDHVSRPTPPAGRPGPWRNFAGPGWLRPPCRKRQRSARAQDGRAPDHGRAADAAVRQGAGPGVHRGRPVPCLQGQRYGNARQRGLCFAHGDGFPGLAAHDRRSRRQAVDALARRAQGAAVANPDHTARLRRGLERHRQVDRRAARPAAADGGPFARARAMPSSTAPTNTSRRPTATASTTKAST